ncbi:hypothetical protein GCM10008968_18130 [Bacillus horti]
MEKPRGLISAIFREVRHLVNGLMVKEANEKAFAQNVTSECFFFLKLFGLLLLFNLR